MPMRYFLYVFVVLVTLSTISCENSKEDFVSESVADYYPTQVGKFIIYRLDSLVFTQSGSVAETHKYQVKHTVQSEITDASGRKTFLVNRLIRNEAGTSAWLENGNYTVTPLADRVEVLEHNLRSIRLVSPFSIGYSWRGYSYYPLFPYQSVYDMDAGNDMNTWDFVYSNFGDTTVNGQQYANLWTVLQNNYVLNIPPTSSQSLGVKEVGVEQYAKGIGLVYKNLEVYERQPPNVDNPQETYTGFGITMWMVEHN